MEKKDYGEPWCLMSAGFSQKSPCPTIYSTGDELRYIAFCSDAWNVIPTDNLSNAERIVACVNALAGIPDPAAEIAAMREVVEQAKKFSIDMAEVGYPCTDGNCGGPKMKSCTHCQRAMKLQAALSALKEVRNGD